MVEVQYPLDLRGHENLLARIESRQVNDDESAVVGELLAGLLLRPGNRDLPGAFELFVQAYEGLGRSEGLRVRLRCKGAAVQSLPWEFARIATGGGTALAPLVLDPRVSLVRYKEMLDPPAVPEFRAELIVASLDAGESGGRTYENLKPESPKVPRRFGSLQVDVLSVAPTRQSLVAQLRGRQVDVFHFSGHGEPEGLVLDYPGGRGTDIVGGRDLATLLDRAAVQLVVLSACHSTGGEHSAGGGSVADALVSIGIPIVVAMQHKVDAANAALFVEAFYRAIFAGLSVDEAVGAGRMKMQGVDYGRPVLHLRSTSGAFLTASAEPSSDDPASALPGDRAVSPTAPSPAAAFVDPGTLDRAAAWSQVSVGPDTWRIEAGAAGPRLSRVPDRMAPLAVERGDGHLAVSPDGRAAVQWSSAGCTAAWVIHHDPHLLHLPRHALPSIGASTLLAATFVGANQVKLILSTAERTYQIRLDPSGFDLPRVLHEEPSLAAVYLDPTTPGTVDPSGRVREDALRRRVPRLAAVSALDAARSDGVSLVAAVGTVADGSPMMVASSSGDVLWVPLAGPATGVVVERRFDEANPLRCIVTAAGTAVIVHEIT